jgi:transcriptional regulatory protein LevR
MLHSATIDPTNMQRKVSTLIENCEVLVSVVDTKLPRSSMVFLQAHRVLSTEVTAHIQSKWNSHIVFGEWK